MKERPSDVAAASPAPAERTSLAVRQFGKRRVFPRFDENRVMKLMPTQCGVCSSDRSVAEEACVPIAEVQLARGEARRVAKQAGHSVARARRVLKSFAKNHVAAALAMDWACTGEFSKSRMEAACVRQYAGV